MCIPRCHLNAPTWSQHFGRCGEYMYIYMSVKGTCHIFLCCSLPCSLETGSFSVTLSSLLVSLAGQRASRCYPPPPSPPAPRHPTVHTVFHNHAWFLMWLPRIQIRGPPVSWQVFLSNGPPFQPHIKGEKVSFFPLCFEMMLNPDVDCSFDNF